MNRLAMIAALATTNAAAVESEPFHRLLISASEGYVTGLEPGTNFPNNRRVERKLGRVPKLAAGASRSTAIDFTIHTGAEETKGLAARVAEIQSDAKPVLDPQPEQKE